MSQEILITMQHVRCVPSFSTKRGYCVAGMREFATRHNLDFDQFVRAGLPASVLEATQDALALRIVHYARGGK